MTAALFEELTPPLSSGRGARRGRPLPRVRRPVRRRRASLACPADVDVPAFVAAIARRRPGEAARTIFAENLLGGTCARVCPVELLCEGACVLAHEGRPPVAIGLLQRFATDAALARGLPVLRGARRATGSASR